IIGKRLQAQVEFLRVFDPVSPVLADPSHGRYLDQIATSFQNQTRDYLEGVASSLRKDGLTVSSIVHEGYPASFIVSEAEREPATLIAMSTHGRSGITRWMLGSVSDKVLQAVTTPLLIIRPRQQSLDPEVRLNSIIVPLDGSGISEQVLPHVSTLAKLLELKVNLIMVTPSEIDYYQYAENLAATYRDLSAKANADALDYLLSIKNRLEQEGVRTVEERLLHGHPAEVIVDHAREVRDNFVAMTTHGHSGIGRWLLGSVADRVVQGSGDPVLVIRARGYDALSIEAEQPARSKLM
ncbi:MAG: universal stress protein, partial [Candidatus Binatia bacterium]